ncbi:tyrosine-type recombinase/integrase [Anaerotruncus massiliensis (ex Togo et al. 2019)]|uniref:tyrosine-type recombinase/integrase n=1 Tax=Anaerotruncus massiliensis (ex Togo et al. 2019) TaxID=1673720 RepID=UPI0027B9956A|nr:tyrosine-type recombinase/integrase [Anaerotruncus massiliensis (ex Togo et al. 2019)]
MICVKCKKEIPDESVFCLHCGWEQSKRAPQRKTKSRGNGTGSIYQLPDGRYKVEVVLGWEADPETQKVKKKRRTGVFTKKKDAIAAIPKLSCKKEERPINFQTLYAEWSGIHYQAISKSKETAYKIAYKKCASLYWTDIKDIRLSEMQRVVDEKGSSFYTKRDIRDLMSLMWQYAMKNDWVEKNYAQFITLPQLEEGEKNPFTGEELQALWKDYADGNAFTGYILLMSYSGMMPGELFIAKKNMIDWEKRTILGCGLKTKKRKETPLVIADIILPVLHDLCEHSASEKLLTMNKDNFYSQFHETMRRCGFVTEHTPYDCRHSTATALALADIPAAVIQKVMRHSKFSTTERYIHVDAAPMLDAINKI